MAQCLPSSEADRLGGHVLALNGYSTGALERKALELMAYSVAVTQATRNDYPGVAQYIVGQFMGWLDDDGGTVR